MELKSFIQNALEEDIGNGDHTSLSTIPSDKSGIAKLLVKEDGILSGLELALEIFNEVDPLLESTVYSVDGDQIKKGDILLDVTGSVRSILKAERLVLNCMQRMCGIATTTNKYVQAVSGTSARIMDTRKTTPLLRSIEKWAVKTGGGYNHRFGLFDMILIKDNHVDSAGGIKEALFRAKEYLEKNKMSLPIEIETRNHSEIEEALSTGIPNRIMFDNFTPEETLIAINLVSGSIETESSGGITILNVRDYAITGVDCISVGALTHSVKSLDLSLKIQK